MMLLLDMGNREWCFSTCGYGITAYTDAVISYVGDKISKDLTDENYVDAFKNYAKESDRMITLARDGKPFSKKDLSHEPLSPKVLLVCFGIGLVGALITVGTMKSQLKSVHEQTAAANYVKKGSMKLTTQQDLFLYSKVDWVKKEEKSNNGNGSTTHKSSSGTKHGGGKGKF